MTSTKQFVWIRNEIYEERNASSVLTKQFFARGQTISGTDYYYSRDILGSVREMSTSGGSIQAQYAFDPFGRMTKLLGSLDSDFQYAGYYEHSRSGLDLTRTRAYSATRGNWLSRDPVGTDEGANEYLYVFNDPINWYDPDGTGALGATWGAAIGGGLGGVAGTAVGGAGGTLVCPGVGTVVAAGSMGEFGFGAGVAVGAAAGSAIEDSICRAKGVGRTDLPAKGKPNSSACKDKGNGKGQIRDYGSDGKAKTDYDFGHDHTGVGDPHAHDWDWTKIHLVSNLGRLALTSNH